jgi:hypothetical protein
VVTHFTDCTTDVFRLQCVAVHVACSDGSKVSCAILLCHTLQTNSKAELINDGPSRNDSVNLRIILLTYLLTHSLTHSLHGAVYYLKS